MKTIDFDNAQLAFYRCTCSSEYTCKKTADYTTVHYPIYKTSSMYIIHVYYDKAFSRGWSLILSLMPPLYQQYILN